MSTFRSIGVALLALALGMGSVTSAQGRDRGPLERGGRHQGASTADQGSQKAKPERRAGRHGGRAGRDSRRNRGAQKYSPRSARPELRGRSPRVGHALLRGGQLPARYRGDRYVVHDWRSHNLTAPPSGARWVHTGSEYVLAVVATGVILQIRLSR